MEFAALVRAAAGLLSLGADVGIVRRALLDRGLPEAEACLVYRAACLYLRYRGAN